MKSASRLRERIRKNLDRRPEALVLSMEEVTSMDSAGLAVLVEAQQWAKKEKILFILARPSSAARAVIEVARLGKFFLFSDSVEKALPE